MKRSYIRLTRAHAAKFTAVGWSKRNSPDEVFATLLSRDQIVAIRSTVLTEAAKQLTTANAVASFHLDTDGNLTVEISATDYTPNVDHITPQSLRRVIKHANEAFKLLPGLITRSAETFLNKDSVKDKVLGLYQGSSSYWDERRFFAMTKLEEASTSSVEFSVSPQVAAACRNPTRLELKTNCSVADYHTHSSADYPMPDQYTVERCGRSSLRVTANTDIAEDVAFALLDESRGPRLTVRSIDRWPPPATPYWSISTLALAIFTVVIAAFRITPAWLVVTALAVAAASGFAVLVARRDGASMWKTALGMAPSAIVLGFAVFYGFVMRGGHPSVAITATKVPHLVDALLLSFGLASTGGFFDLGLRTLTVRVVAFAEMLLMLSIAGGSLYLAAHAVWDRLGEILRNPQG